MHEYTDLDVFRLLGFGEIRRRDKSLELIHDNTLGMKAGTLSGFLPQGAGVVVEFREKTARRSRPRRVRSRSADS
jgi:hypothetical protein